MVEAELRSAAAGGGCQFQFVLRALSQQQFCVEHRQKCVQGTFQTSMIYRVLVNNRLCWLSWLLVRITATRRKMFLDILVPCIA